MYVCVTLGALFSFSIFTIFIGIMAVCLPGSAALKVEVQNIQNLIKIAKHTNTTRSSTFSTPTLRTSLSSGKFYVGVN